MQFSIHATLSTNPNNRSNPSTTAVYQVVLMEAVRVHEGYVPGKNDHDIAIVYLQVVQ